MNINVEELSGLERKLSVEIPVERVNETYGQIYQSIQRQYDQPGFRKGKVPMQVIKSKFADKVDQDALEYLIGPAWAQAIRDNNLEPVMNPKFDHEPVKEGQAFSFTATFEVKPEIELKSIEGVEVKKEKVEISDENVSDVIENLRKNKGVQKPVEEDRAAKDGDVAVIDFEGFIDGEPLEGGKGENHDLELGAKQFIDGFEEGVVGMKKGEEKELTLKFPEEYHASDIAGKDVVFKVKLNEIKEFELPEVNDEFAANVGDHENVQALKDSIRETLSQHEEKRVKDELKTRLMEKLVELNPIEVPKGLKVEQKKLIVQDAQMRMSQQGMSPEDVTKYLATNDADFDKSSEFIIKSSYLISEIAKAQDIKTTPEAFQKFINARAQEIGIPAEQLMSYYNNEDAKARVDFQILEEQVMDFVIEKAKIEEVAKDQL
ncbi:MAG: trigger factor [Bdellovibrionaceae bacterium]|nr:trigger factor [Pseudobdellovibrionaceae bacterium]|tara:strand:+ start:19987 stop:21285 length:1299 start_codon:yes stop_codon:yes gene_type:complete